MLFSEIIGIRENHMKYKNTCVNSVKFLLFRQLVDTELNYIRVSHFVILECDISYNVCKRRKNLYSALKKYMDR